MLGTLHFLDSLALSSTSKKFRGYLINLYWDVNCFSPMLAAQRLICYKLTLSFKNGLFCWLASLQIEWGCDYLSVNPNLLLWTKTITFVFFALKQGEAWNSFRPGLPALKCRYKFQSLGATQWPYDATLLFDHDLKCLCQMSTYLLWFGK